MFTNQKKRTTRAVLASGAALLSAIALTACGTKVSGQSAQSAAAGTTITYWSSWSKGEPQQILFDRIISDFKRRTGITVTARYLGRNYISTVENAAAVGNGPDIYDSGTDHIAEFRSKGLVGSVAGVLGSKIPGERSTVKQVLSAPVLTASSDDKGVGLIPHTIISTGIWFDASKHPELATTPPATWADFLATAKSMKASTGQAPISQDGNINFYNAYWFYWLQMRNGGPNTLSALGGAADAWDAPSVLQSAQDVEQLVKADLFEKDYMGTQYPAAQNEWAQRKSTFELNGSWLASETAKNQASGFEPQTFPFPTTAGGHDSVDVGTLGWSINAKSTHTAADDEFLAFAMQKKYISQIATKALNITSRSDVPAPEALQNLQSEIIAAKEVNKTYDQAPSLHAGWWNDVFLPLDDKLFSGKLTATQFVAQGKAQTTTYLANH